ncbi:hypothetical protein GT755_35705 [Herbidospora sp. NEAU-GS84]|uniref:Streptomyces killer toxin-like beta/gamma crystallin domain-containing protein n=1 Tax=Herbidospora solisilvae TaxID=2696284 RepID=A0A7C9JGX1_9ACTN|nr:hypothetical protein [Herbidospora solisilvae]NAS27004.1 hypothetical protein [Herbidospora solisilvae]
MRKIHKLAVVSGAISALLLGAAPPAMAASSSCSIPLFWTTCTTGTVAANSGSHDLMVIATNCPGPLGGTTLGIKLQDVGTGQYFWHSTVPYGYARYVRVSGLYGSYKLRLDGEPTRYGQLTTNVGGWTPGLRAC